MGRLCGGRKKNAPARGPPPADPGRPAADQVEDLIAVDLVVDDAPDSLRFLTDTLEGEGYGVRIARDGHAALASLAAELPDLVLMDAVMPGIDGFETTRRIKADPA